MDLNDNFLIYNIATKNYYEYCMLQKKLIIADIKLILVFTHNPYLFYVKRRINNEATNQTILDNYFLKPFKNIAASCNDNSIGSLRSIFQSYISSTAFKALFLVHGAIFYCPDQNVLSRFYRYPFESTCTLKYDYYSSFS
jgi:hypothetical protein